MSVVQRHVQIARSLPPQLRNFFLRHPPAINTPDSQPSQIPHDAGPPGSTTAPTSLASSQLHSDPQRTGTLPNPFTPYKNPETGRWRPPVYSLRQQADLLRQASAHNCLTLLPWSPKLASRVRKSAEDEGIRVKGTGIGQRVKGKLWERTQKGKLETRRKAMEGMNVMIRNWKLLGHGRGWKKWPKRGGVT